MAIRELAQRYGKPLIITTLVFFVIWTIRGSWGDIAKLHPQNYGVLGMAMALFVVSYLIQAAGWHLLLRALAQPIALRDSARMFFLSLIARWMPGRILYAGTRLYIGRELGLSVTAVAFAIVLELIYILIGGVIVTVAFAGTLLAGVLSGPHSALAICAAVGLIVGAGAIVIRPSTLISLSRLAFFRKIIKKIAGEELSDANQPQLTTSSSLLLILYFTGYWLFCGVMFGVLTNAFVNMNVDRWLACVPAFAGSWLIGFFSFITPAGIGVREYAMTVMLQHSMGQAAAIVMSVASRIAMMFTELLLAGVAYLFMRDQVGSMPFRAKAGTASMNPATAGMPSHMADRTLRMPLQSGLKLPPSTEPNELLRHAVVNGTIPASTGLLPASSNGHRSEPAPPVSPQPVWDRTLRQIPASQLGRVDERLAALQNGHNGVPPPAQAPARSGAAPWTPPPPPSRVDNAPWSPVSASSNGSAAHGKRSIGGHGRQAADWTLVKRRPCFCGRETVQSGKIPTSRYKPFKSQRTPRPAAPVYAEGRASGPAWPNF